MENNFRNNEDKIAFKKKISNFLMINNQMEFDNFVSTLNSVSYLLMALRRYVHEKGRHVETNHFSHGCHIMMS